jgi:hypothetical protein
MTYLLCIDNSDYEASLEKLKLYPALDDTEAAGHGMVRVIDESGEDYLFERDRFLDLQLDPFTAARIADLRQP